eukprot:TRINITY_DN29425_c0_g2_i1.p2 TRINITY_DN29425_c0_g2~~TRINITY_DN29425_c0_g2_i1.p2  ORF type:complete len:229 (+),score=42.87 TRINITY_DN29425_c0_g2_i1:56-688(+)
MQFRIAAACLRSALPRPRFDLAVVCGQRRGFARRRPGAAGGPVPLALPLEGGDAAAVARGAKAAKEPPHDWSLGPPPAPPRIGGYRRPERRPQHGAPARLASLLPEGPGFNPPYLDPGSPPAGIPIEEDRPPPPWKVLRTQNGNLPVYEQFRKHGTEVTTYIKHFYGDVETMRKDLNRVCEAPVRVRAGALEVRGLHSWKIKEWLVSLGM